MKIHLIKAAIFLLLLGVFYACGGFDRPSFDDYVGRNKRQLVGLWMLSVVLYGVGAFAILWGNKTEGGSLHPTSLRWFYVLVGILAMIGALVIMQSVKWVDSPPSRTSHPAMQLNIVSPTLNKV